MQPQESEATRRLVSGRVRVGFLLAVVVLSAVALTGCSRGSYPLDYFMEMHYHQSYKLQEPPSLSAPADAVPRTGREVEYTLAQARLLPSPPPNAQTVARGAKLFQVNCAVCHGIAGKGDGPMKERLTQAGYASVPADLSASGPTKAKPDGELFLTITKGYARAYGLPEQRFVMPSFQKLLTEEDRWAVVSYLRELQK